MRSGMPFGKEIGGRKYLCDAIATLVMVRGVIVGRKYLVAVGGYQEDGSIKNLTGSDRQRRAVEKY